MKHPVNRDNQGAEGVPRPTARTERRDDRHSFRGDRGRESAICTPILDLDRELLRLIARRCQLLRNLPQGRDGSRFERELRAGWEMAASHVSRDPRLIHQLFGLLQQVECQSRQEDSRSDKVETFGLSPAQKPVDFTFAVPADCRLTRIWGALAAMSASRCELAGILVNDPLVELVKAFNQVSPSLRWLEDGRLLCVPEHAGTFGKEKMLLDRAVHVGGDMLNFLLLLFAMAVRPCRLKLMGEGDLRLVDMSALRHFLPAVGARFTSIVPGQEGLPARLEASGILPSHVVIPADLPEDAVLALCLALACVQREGAITLQIGQHPRVASIMSDVRGILGPIVSSVQIGDREAIFLPQTDSGLHVPVEPKLPVDIAVATLMLSLPAFAGGTARITGSWPDTPAAQAAGDLLKSAGLRLTIVGNEVASVRDADAAVADISCIPAGLPAALLPLVVALAARPVLHAGQNGDCQAVLPALPEYLDRVVMDGFLSRLGVVRDGNRLHATENGFGLPWSSPSAMWAVALALAACVRPGLQLLNPGIVTEFMPNFWKWYNGLPSPVMLPAGSTEAAADVRPARRRIRAGYMPEDQMPEPLPLPDDY